MSLTHFSNWHRWVGLSVSLFVVMLCITGILLNHSRALGLAQQFVHSEWLLDMYDITPAQAPVSFQVGAHRLTRIGNQLFFDALELTERSAALIGAVSVQDQIVAGLSDRLLILTPAGQTIEVLREAEGVPPDLRRIGTTADGGLVIKSAHGQFLPDLDSLHWHPDETATVYWAEPAALPADLADTLLQGLRQDALTLERVLLDIHSGRIVNRFGVWFMDMIAVVLLSLVLSGLWVWYRR